MAVPILMPSLSPTMTEGSLAKWCKNIGDEVKPGDIIAEVETDKATMEIEAIDEGILDKVLYQDGTEGIAVNSLIAVLKNKDDTDDLVTEVLKKYKSETKNIEVQDASKNSKIGVSKNEEVEVPIEENNTNKNIEEKSIDLAIKNQELIENKNISYVEDANIPINTDDNKNVVSRIIASPLAKRLAMQNNIDLTNVNGSGPRGRIVKKDIDILLNKNNSLNNIVNIKNKFLKISSMRKTIAERLSFSKSNVPHFYLNINCNVDNLLLARKQMNDSRDDTSKISINDIIIKALAISLHRVPEANCSWGDKEITYFGSVDIGVAVAVKDGLFTPVIRSAESIQISEISRLMKDFIKKANDGKLMPKDYEGGSFSISNLGMFNIDNFSAIINPPQAGILAVGAIKKSPIVINDEITICNSLSCQLSGDHRVIDGAVGAKLLNEFKSIIENPYKMLL